MQTSYLYIAMGLIATLAAAGAAVAYSSFFIPIPTATLKRLENSAAALLFVAVVVGVLLIQLGD